MPLYKNEVHEDMVWKNLSDLYKALTSTLMNTFGMNMNTDCHPTNIK